LKLWRRLTEEALGQRQERVSDFQDVLYGIRKEFSRERLLRSLPREALIRLRVVGGLKFLFLVILVVEVICLQR
jgi:hypothetical protein